MKIDPDLKESLKTYLSQQLTQQKKKVTVLSPYQLEETEKKQLQDLFPQLHNVDIVYKVDELLLGGVVIRFGSKTIDLSLKNELQNLKQRIYDVN